MRDYPSERPMDKVYIKLRIVPKRSTRLNYGTIHSRRGFGTILGGYWTGYGTFQDSAKNGRF